VGYVTSPFSGDKPATHALVFILRGIAHSWKQTVAYYFTGNSTPGDLLWTVGDFISSVLISVAATKLSSKFHAKVSRNFLHESLNLFYETFP